MSAYRQQALIDVPLATVWELVRDPNRHPEWWPRVVKVQCDPAPVSGRVGPHGGVPCAVISRASPSSSPR